MAMILLLPLYTIAAEEEYDEDPTPYDTEEWYTIMIKMMTNLKSQTIGELLQVTYIGLKMNNGIVATYGKHISHQKQKHITQYLRERPPLAQIY